MKGIKTLSFLVLLVLVTWQYAVDIYVKFNNDSTTFVSKTVDAESFIMPPLTICMDYALKPSVLKKYGLNNLWDFVFSKIDNEEKNISSIWDFFLEASYLIGRDMEISIYDKILTVGNNDVYQVLVELKEYHTFYAGTCYQIKSNFSIPPPNVGEITVTFANSLDKVDQPKVRGTKFF